MGKRITIKQMRQQIFTFEDGLDTLTDPRRLKPNNNKETVAGSPDMENVEITKTGSILTSTGFEEVSSIASTGGAKNLLDYEKNDTTHLLIITHGDKHYYITPDDSTWVEVGDYGTEANYVGGTVYKCSDGSRYSILGNDIAANTMQKYDYDHAMQNVGGTPPDSYIMETFMGRLWAASGSTLYYTNVDDEDDWAGGGTIGFNDIITGLKKDGSRLTVFTKSYHQGVTFTFDSDYNISVPGKEINEREPGCLAHKSVRAVYSDIYYWSDIGVMSLGSERNYVDQALPRPQSLSTLIDPSLEYTNKAYRKDACSLFYQQQYYLSVPYGTDNFNSRTFVYNRNRKAWTLRTGIYPTDWSLFRDSNYKNEVYFTDYFASRLLKFNDSYSYAGSGYTRKWTSKKFVMGDANRMKKWKWIDITGSIDEATEIRVRIQVDNNYKEYKIDRTELEVDAFGEYIGDNFLGDAYLGGAEAEDSRFKRFRSRLQFPKDLTEGFDMQITIYNSAEEQPWKIDYIGIEYDMLPVTQIPNKYINNQPIP